MKESYSYKESKVFYDNGFEFISTLKRQKIHNSNSIKLSKKMEAIKQGKDHVVPSSRDVGNVFNFQTGGLPYWYVVGNGDTLICLGAFFSC